MPGARISNPHSRSRPVLNNEVNASIYDNEEDRYRDVSFVYMTGMASRLYIHPTPGFPFNNWTEVSYKENEIYAQVRRP